MVHSHPVNDTDKHFIIDPITRAVANAEMKKTILMQHDHNSERFTFEIDRMVEEHDLTLCNKVEVHYSNIDATKKNRNLGVYEVDDLQVAADDESKIVFSWLVSENATVHNGSLNFLILFACVENGQTVYRWHTDINSSISISKGMNNDEEITETYPDILTQWKDELFAAVYGYKNFHIGPIEPEDYPYIWFDTSHFVDNPEKNIGVITVKDAEGNKNNLYPFTMLDATDFADFGNQLEQQGEQINEAIKSMDTSFEEFTQIVNNNFVELNNDLDARFDAAVKDIDAKLEEAEEASDAAHDALNRSINNEAATRNQEITTLTNSKQSNLIEKSASLPQSAWSNNVQTISVEGVTATNHIIVTPDPGYFVAWNESMVRATTQGDGTVSFACEYVPESDLVANFVIWE